MNGKILEDIIRYVSSLEGYIGTSYDLHYFQIAEEEGYIKIGHVAHSKPSNPPNISLYEFEVWLTEKGERELALLVLADGH